MAARYRPSAVDIWRDPRFCSLSDDAKLLSRYAITGPQTNRIGLMHFSLALAAEDLQWSPERLGERFAECVQTLGWGWDSAHRMLLIRDWWLVNKPANPNIFKAYLGDLDGLPTSPLIAEFCANVKNLSPALAELLANVSRNVSANVPPNHPPQEQEQEQEREQEKEPPPPPTPSRHPAQPPGTGWAEVEGVLLAAGMSAVPKAIAGAQARGATPDAVAALYAEWAEKPGAWEVGALHRRITGDLASWPPPRGDYQRRAAHDDASSAAARKAAANAEQRRVDAENLAREDEELAALEGSHGAQLDAISWGTGREVERLRSLFERTYGSAWESEIRRFRNRRAAGDPMARGMRIELLRTLAASTSPSSPECSVEPPPGPLGSRSAQPAEGREVATI